MRTWMLAMVLGLVVAAPGAAQAKAKKAKHVAKVAIEDARKTALAKVPGKLLHEELEQEHGTWIYSFEIRPEGEKGKTIKEVNIDADTGAVVAVETEHDE